MDEIDLVSGGMSETTKALLWFGAGVAVGVLAGGAVVVVAAAILLA